MLTLPSPFLQARNYSNARRDINQLPIMSSLGCDFEVTLGETGSTAEYKSPRCDQGEEQKSSR